MLWRPKIESACMQEMIFKVLVFSSQQNGRGKDDAYLERAERMKMIMRMQCEGC